MNEMAAIKKHLGISTTEAQLNHYSLIGVSQDATVGEIKQALKNAAAAWNNSDRSSDPESAQHVAKLIKQAQAILLDEAKKKEYDKTLVIKDNASTKVYFPKSDPFGPFDPTQCLTGSDASSLSFGSIEERWEELSRQIQILNEPVIIGQIQSVADVGMMSQRSVPAAPTPSKSAESASARIERLKRARKNKQILFLASFLILALAFLGFAGFMFIWNRMQVARQNEAKAAEAANAPALAIVKETVPKTVPKTIGGKNAPKGNASESTFVLPTLSKEDSSTDPAIGIGMQAPVGEPMKPVESMSEPTPAEPMKPAEPMVPAPAPGPAADMKPNSPMNSVPEKPMDMPTAGSKAEWVAVMKKARAAIDKADFKTFNQQIELALPLSADADMSAKRARLDQLGQLYEIFIKAMHEAKTKMRGAESLSVGKMQVSIVEVKENELIVRVQGKNERYPWDRLPPGIANAMADFALDDSDPTDIAARAVYFSLSPAKNDLFAKRVKEWFEKSVGKGSIRQDLVQALTDKYE